MINERDILGTQLIRRNDELSLLYEKIKIQQSTLNKGETQYSQRLEDIRILKLEIKKMRREKNMLSRSVANIEDLRYTTDIICGTRKVWKNFPFFKHTNTDNKEHPAL